MITDYGRSILYILGALSFSCWINFIDSRIGEEKPEKITKMRKTILLFSIMLSDILTKYWVNISDPEFSVIGNIIRITHVKNTGVAFGTPLPGISFVIPVILLSIGVFLWKSWNKISEIEKTGYLVIITGGLLNALERTIFGSVTDFISVQYFSVFNMADMAITG